MTVLLRLLAQFTITSLLFAATLAAAETESRLVEAAKRGDEATVGRLLKRDADANATAPDGATAIHWAAHLDEREMAELLVRAGADVNVTNRYGVTPLKLACTNGNAAIVQLLLEAGADLNAATSAGETPLMIAARTGKPHAIRVLLAGGADPNGRESRRGQTALMWASADGHVEAVKVLIHAAAEIEMRSKGGFTAFLFAVRQGRIGVVRVLLEAGADVEQSLPAGRGRRHEAPEKPTGTSALGLAVANAHYELAAALLDAGADPNRAWQGRTSLHTITWVRKPGAGSNDPAPLDPGTWTVWSSSESSSSTERTSTRG